MRFGSFAALVLFSFPASAVFAAETPFFNMQAVNADGTPAYSLPSGQQLTLTGVVLNNPADMLDSTPNYIPWNGSNFWVLGAEWQIFVQSVDPADNGGVALYMAQNYGNTSFRMDSGFSYTNEEWQSEMNRVTTNGTLQAGILVQITARTAQPFGGKYNINESHFNVPETNFDITILNPNYGLPTAIPLTLDLLKDISDDFIFDHTRVAGNEKYQSQLVTLQNVSLVNGSLWAPDEYVTVTDGTGRTFSLHLGLNAGFNSAAPTGSFNVTGIFNQEDGGSGKEAYELWVMNPNAITLVPEPNGLALASVAVLSCLRFKRRRNARITRRWIASCRDAASH